MALTPQNDNAFFREVDENLRHDRLVGRARRYGPLVAGVVLLFLAVLAGALWWRSHRAHEAGLASEALDPAITALSNGQPAPDPAALARLAAGARPAYAAAARFALADAAVQKGDAVAAAATLDALAADAAVAQPQRDMALLRATALRFDTLPPAQVIDRLKGLAVSGQPWFPTAGELTALAWLKLGRKDKAGPLFAAIARDPDVPQSMRGRVAGMATSLGQAVPPPAAQTR